MRNLLFLSCFFLLSVSLFAQKNDYPFTVSPLVTYPEYNKVLITWGQENAESCSVFYGVNPRQMKEKKLSAAKMQRFALNGLPRNTKFHFYIQSASGRSKDMTFNTTFNYNPYDVDKVYSKKFAAQAVKLLKDSGIRKGFALVFGKEGKDLAYEIVQASDLNLLHYVDNKADLQELRKFYFLRKVHGRRVNVLLLKEGKTVSASNSINLIVNYSDTDHSTEIKRLLKPQYGRLYLKDSSATSRYADFKKQKGSLLAKDSMNGIGQWTHQYGLASNTGNSGEQLNGKTSPDDLSLQWLGNPGADFGIDRNPRMPAPLASSGRLFHQGLNRMIALDAMNGTILWTVEMPMFRRVNIPRDASNWCADEKHIYTSLEDQTWVFDAQYGARRKILSLPKSFPRDKYDWGYIANYKDRIVGSTVKKASAYTNYWTQGSWYDKQSDAHTGKVCSTSLFAYKKGSYELAWTYDNKSTIINTAIGVEGDKVYFVESRNEAVYKNKNSRIASGDLWKNLFLVGISLTDGKRLFEQSLDIQPGKVVFFLLSKEDRVVLCSSDSNHYHLNAYDSSTGKKVWNQKSKWPATHHGGHMIHPTIRREFVYTVPNEYRLSDGKLNTTLNAKRVGCHTFLATENAYLNRGPNGEIAMLDVETKSQKTFKRIRPSCWLSVIPANGMVLIPEGGGGCSCGKWMETSFGFASWPQLTKKEKDHEKTITFDFGFCCYDFLCIS